MKNNLLEHYGSFQQKSERHLKKSIFWGPNPEKYENMNNYNKNFVKGKYLKNVKLNIRIPLKHV